MEVMDAMEEWKAVSSVLSCCCCCVVELYCSSLSTRERLYSRSVPYIYRSTVAAATA